MLILGRADLEKLLTPLDVIEALADAFARHARGLTLVPPRAVTQVTDDGYLIVMPAAARGDGDAAHPGGGAAGAEGGALRSDVGAAPRHGDAARRDLDAGLGTKLVTYYGRNRERGAPTLHAIYVLMNAATGAPRALLEGTYVTALRTGAASALAARHLARRDARRIACFGAGVQAGFHLRCFAAVLPVAHVDVVGRDPERAGAFAAAMTKELGVPVVVAPDARAAVRSADLVTCATTSAVPVVFGADLSPGTHVDAVGAFRPDTREVDTDTVRRARVVVDTYAGALEEAGDLLIPMTEGTIDRSHVSAELAELVTGARPGRTSAEEITMFKSVGFALEDLATARLAWARARERGVGTEVSL